VDAIDGRLLATTALKPGVDANADAAQTPLGTALTTMLVMSPTLPVNGTTTLRIQNVNMGQQVDFLQLNSWNNFSSPSYIGPARSMDGEVTTRLPHDGVRDLLRYELAQYKGSSASDSGVEKEVLVVTYKSPLLVPVLATRPGRYSTLSG